MRAAPGRASGLALAVAGLSLTGMCAWLEARSTLAPVLRSGEPLAALAALRFEGQPGVVPPALYLAVRSRERLDLMFLPPFARAPEGRTLADAYGRRFLDAKDARSADAAMGDAALEMLRKASPGGAGSPLAAPLRLRTALGADARPADPVEVQERLASWAADPLLWLRLAAETARRRSPEGLGAYDSLLLARRLAGSPAVRLWRLSEPGLLAPALGRILRAEEPPGVEAPGRTPTVEVLNASGADGLALRATKILRWSGLDVVHYGDGPGPEPRMRFVDRSGRPAAAAAAAEALGCPGDVVTAWESEPPASVTVVLGRDFARCARLSSSAGAETGQR